ncbi:hypothetical protein BJX65DRAFT_291492 [Aspergillus insuetus]
MCLLKWPFPNRSISVPFFVFIFGIQKANQTISQLEWLTCARAIQLGIHYMDAKSSKLESGLLRLVIFASYLY